MLLTANKFKFYAPMISSLNCHHLLDSTSKTAKKDPIANIYAIYDKARNKIWGQNLTWSSQSRLQKITLLETKYYLYRDYFKSVDIWFHS